MTDSIHLAFPTTLGVGKNKPLEHTCTYQCHGCLFFFTAKNKYQNYLKNSAKMPNVIYKFENQNLVTFEDNFKYLGDLPFVA